MLCLLVGVGLYCFAAESLGDQYPMLHNPVVSAAVGAVCGGLVNIPVTWLVKGKKKIKNLDE